MLFESIDFSPYRRLKAKTTQSGYEDITLDVSSINQSGYLGVCANSDNGGLGLRFCISSINTTGYANLVNVLAYSDVPYTTPPRITEIILE